MDENGDLGSIDYLSIMAGFPEAAVRREAAEELLGLVIPSDRQTDAGQTACWAYERSRSSTAAHLDAILQAMAITAQEVRNEGCGASLLLTWNR